MLYDEIGEKYLQIQMQTHSENKHSEATAVIRREGMEGRGRGSG